MRYAVKIAGADLPYACVGCWPKPCGLDFERKPFNSDFSTATEDRHATTGDHAIAEAVAKARGGKVVKVLSHEEAKRKYAAKLLMNIAVEQHGEADSGIWSRNGSEGVRAVANTLESIAEEQWPALFHEAT